MGRQRVVLVCPDCGKTREDTLNNYKKRGHSLCNPCSRMKNFGKDYIGKTYGRVTIISDADPVFSKSGERRQMVNCVCSCGKTFVSARRALFSGATVSCGCFTKERLREACGEKSPAYNHDLTVEERKEFELSRVGNRIRIWRIAVRACGQCAVCGSTEKLVAHHLESFKVNPELRFDVNNGVCLCASCHVEYHAKFLGGYRNLATTASFDEFARSKNDE